MKLHHIIISCMNIRSSNWSDVSAFLLGYPPKYLCLSPDVSLEWQRNHQC
uniref:Uncharacterized protein n=1 Tax=Rhizophora mucronata TaxID=61149 RepID=A0A2P2PXB9_RHIMU